MTARIVNLPVDQCYGNPDQPRKLFALAQLEELAASIRMHGVMQPITVVRRASPHGLYLVVMGERRLRASKIAKAEKIPAIVRDNLNEEKLAELALIENLARADLTILEEARAYQSFLERGYTVESLGEVLGYAQPWRIQERLNLLKLAPALLDGLAKGAVTASQAQEMSRLSYEGQYILWNAIQDGRCPTFQTLRRTTAAILDRENQRELFKTAEITAGEKRVLSKIDRFVLQSAKLVSLVTPEDLETMNTVAKGNARVCAEQLALLEKLCRDLRNALLANAAKQELLFNAGEPK